MERAARALFPLPVRQRVFAGLNRKKEDGTFDDKDLANILYGAIISPAGAFRAQGSPASTSSIAFCYPKLMFFQPVMSFVDIRGIERARELKCVPADSSGY
jgi:hypothetical protein